MDSFNCKENSQPPLWRPSRRMDTTLDKFRKIINQKYSLNLENYSELHGWSCENYAEFWEEVWIYCNIVHSTPFCQIVDTSKCISDIPEWFHGARLNYAENLLRFNDDNIALYCTGEGQKKVTTRTFRELRESVARYASAMIKMGVVKGDRVVGYLPNCCEAVEAMLATASLGAIWSSTSPDFGVVGVLDRFSQIHPKLMFSVNAVRYNARIHNHRHKLQEVVKGLSDLEKVVVIPFVTDCKIDLCDIPKSCTLDQFLSHSDPEPTLEFTQVPFNHPLFIMYSSGTTGVPKCMVHSVGGTLLKHIEEHVVQSGMTRADVILFYTTTGWMMWNWLMTCLAVGSGVVLYDGSPLVPHPRVLWDLAEHIGITILGMGAKCFSVFQEREVKPVSTHKLPALRMIMSTGSPLKPATFDYLYNDVKHDLIVASISGGTDIIACFMGQSETVPVYRGEVQCLLLGCDVQTWDDNGRRVYDQSGELIVATPFPSMPVYFWNDPHGIKYKKAYFAKFNGVWAHGDFCRINSRTGGVVMLGRSDGTLNPNGVRFGTADIYNVVESLKEVTDCVCVPQRSAEGSDERVVLFVKVAAGWEWSEDFEGKVRREIREALSARHVPAVILPVTDIPYTLSGKKVESAVRQVLTGDTVVQLGALSNPQSLHLYRDLPQLADY